MTQSTPINVKSGSWRTELFGRTERLRLLAENIPDNPRKASALTHLGDAEQLTSDGRNPVEAWSGSQIERAWTQLRLAEEVLMTATDDPATVTANARTAAAKAKGRLHDTDDRVVALSRALAALPALPNKPTPDQIAEVKAASVEVAKATHEVSDQQHRTQREFRNLLRKLTIGLAGLAITVIVVALIVPVPPGWILAPTGATPGQAVCWAFVFGALGALFSAIPSISQAPSNSTTYTPTTVQSALKIVVGGWSALVGLTSVTAGLQPAAGDATTFAGFAMMCAVFGAMQEAITRFADHQAAINKPVTA